MEISLIQTEASLAVSQIASTALRKEVDRLQKYSKINGLVVEGIPLSNNKTPKEQLNKASKIIKN